MTEKLRVNQALYGYRDGHRLLASSTTMLPEVQRVLRSVTDTAFSTSDGPYLTILPLPAQNMQAFVRTWPALDWIRPGSVWSHVLLVDHADLAGIQGLAHLHAAFRAPSYEDGRLLSSEIKQYERPLQLEAAGYVDASGVDPRLFGQVIELVYSTEDPVQFQVQRLREAELALWAIYEQQWPRLRRTFACRTRNRASSTSLDLELLDGRSRIAGSGGQMPMDPTISAWLEAAVADLRSPDPLFRSFLLLGGAEATGGRSDFVNLTNIYVAASAELKSASSVGEYLRGAYPDSKSHRVLKRALFGRSRGEVARGWPADEEFRVRGAFEVASCLDFRDLMIGERLVDLHRSGGAARRALNALVIETLSVENVEALVSGVTLNADWTTAVNVAANQPDLGLLIVSQKPELLSESILWERLDGELLIDLLHERPAVRREVLDALVIAKAHEPVARVCSAFPDEWWRLLRDAARVPVLDLVDRATALRSALLRMGTAALDSPPIRPQSAPELATLVLAADLSSGLWRRVQTADWLQAVSLPDSGDFLRNLPRNAQERMFAVALVSAASGSSVELRRQAWQACFGFLHQALVSRDFDDEAWRLLGDSLPAGTQWDRCHRLRRGAASEIRRDLWPAQDVRMLISAAAPYDRDLLELVDAQSQRKKKDGLLRSLMRLLQ